MRIAINDYGGHGFSAALARGLAARGHQVLHVHFADVQGPKGDNARRPGDPPGLSFRAVTLGEPFRKFDFVARWRQERRAGRLIAATIGEFAPEVILTGNAPIDVQLAVAQLFRPYVFWLQDVVSLAMSGILGRRLGLAGRTIGAWYGFLERRLLRRAAGVVAITEDFRPLLAGWGVSGVEVIENWAPIADIPVLARANAWAASRELGPEPVILYAGTLALKHDPSLILALALGCPQARIVVVSEGPGADWLRAATAANLTVLPFQPFDRLAEVLASADILLAVLEPDAGVFSVPSKVLSYFCAGRPVLAALPAENLAARLIGREEAGIVVPPGAGAALAEAASRLLADPAEAARLGANGRAYAERAFDLDAVTRRFEAVLERATLPR